VKVHVMAVAAARREPAHANRTVLSIESQLELTGPWTRAGRRRKDKASPSHPLRDFAEAVD
jgi:hypothetical protein